MVIVLGRVYLLVTRKVGNIIMYFEVICSSFNYYAGYPMTFTSDTLLNLYSSVEPFTGNNPQDPHDCHSQRVKEMQKSSTVIISPRFTNT